MRSKSSLCQATRPWFRSRTNGGAILVLLLAVTAMVAGSTAFGQSLNWEGQTGIFVTPMAYLAPSTDKGFGVPVVGYHYFNGGPVLGGFHQASVTMGAFKRLEFGYTRGLHDEGSTAGLSNLWGGGFNTFHGKLNLIEERDVGRSWLPTVSAGFVARSQVRNVGGVMLGKDTTNADYYVVATKSVTEIHRLPLVFNLGYKATNASLLGLAGNAPAYKGRLFGAAAFVIRGPARSTLILASELMQEPRNVEGLPNAVIPTTITYALRIVPAGAFFSRIGWMDERPKLTIDLGVAQVAGTIQPGVNLQARQQFALGVSYGF